MRALRVPRSGSMVLSMMVALLAVFALPFVFLGALAHSAEAHPPSMRETLATLARPLEAAVSRGADYCRRHLR